MMIGRLNRIWWGSLVAGSPRYQIWRDILDGDEVPLKSPVARSAGLGIPPKEMTSVYELDVSRLTDQQRIRLIAFVCQKFKEPAAVVDETIKREGFPVRADDVSVGFSLRAFLLI